MSTKLKIIVSTVAVSSALSFAVPAVFAAQPKQPAAAAHDGAGRHPALNRAVAALEEAKTDLKNAAHDFGGHREAA